MTLQVRTAEPDDIPRLGELWVPAWSQAMPEIDFESRRSWLTDHLTNLQGQGAAVLVATLSGKHAGFVTVEASGYVDQLAVAIDQQGQGVGSVLLQAARGRTMNRLHLTVNAANVAAVRFYERRGFIKTGTGSSARSGLPVIHMRSAD